MTMLKPVIWGLVACLLAACSAGARGTDPRGVFAIEPVASFERPWAMTFLPDGRLLVTEKAGRLLLVSTEGDSVPIDGVPAVDHGGQGGLGDVVLHPDFPDNQMVYLSYAEAGEGGTRGAAVSRARLELNPDGGGRLSGDGGQLSGADGGRLSGVEVIWRQVPKVSGRGHYGHRLAFDADGFLFISSGERQKFDPAQDLNANLGKILRLRDDGSIPPDNPFAASEGAVATEVWSLGQRNPLGIAFDARGRLWEVEMGPAGGDELNLIERGHNYGYPVVSNGDHYDGRDIPDHHTRPEFTAPLVSWTPVISPASLMIYSGELFADWRGNGFVAGLSSESLVRLELNENDAREIERFAMGERIRAVAEGPQGAIYLLEDGSDGRLLKLTPAS